MSGTPLQIPPPTRVGVRLTRLKVSDFGPVRAADLDLTSDLTFIIGPGNSGKTYLASLAYGLAKSTSAWLLTAYTGGFADVLREQGTTGQVSSEALLGLTDKHSDALVRRLAANPILTTIPNQLPPLFGVSQLPDLIRRGADVSGLLAEFAIGGRPLLELEVRIARAGQSTVTVRPTPESFRTVVGLSKPQLTVMGQGGWAAQWGGGLSIAGVRYVPVERLVFIPFFASYLNPLLNLLKVAGQSLGLPLTALQPQQHRQVYVDYLESVTAGFNQLSQKKQPARLLDFGQLEVNPPRLDFRDSRRDVVIPIAAAASGVAQLAGLIPVAELEPGDETLYVEEPELNLHADAQLRVARYLVGLTSKRPLVITTHSHYVATMLGIELGKHNLRSLCGYFLDPDTDSAERMDIDTKTGQMSIPKSIERALEEVAAASVELEDSDGG